LRAHAIDGDVTTPPGRPDFAVRTAPHELTSRFHSQRASGHIRAMSSAEASSAPAPVSTPDDTTDPETKWLREVYQGDRVPQLTVRAVIVGMVLGGVMSLTNLYIAIKSGWSFGVTITAGILAYAMFGLLRTMRITRAEFGMLENNAMQSVASAAGYMTGGGTVAAIPALMIATHQNMPAHVMFFWITAIAILGVFMAIPMKRQMINSEGLPFPSGIAAAETLRSLHAHGDDARRRARGLIWSGAIAAIVTWWRDANAAWLRYPKLPESWGLPFSIHGIAAKRWTLAIDSSLVLYAGGAIMGWRSAWSLMAGAVINYALLVPYGHSIHAITTVSQSGIVKWTLWFGSSLLLTSGLLSFAFSWRQVARAFGDVGKIFGASKTKSPPRESGVRDGGPTIDEVEVPMRWFVIGTALMTPVVIVLATVFFGMKWWMGLLGVAMSFFIAIVACRATGETDTTPTGALGKITQLTFGMAAPGSVTVNLMSANLTAGVAIHSADLLTDLKSGHLLGAKPRQQFFAQFFGVLAGSAFVVPAFRLLVPDWQILGTERAPVPGALSWNAVAQVLARGVSQLPTSSRWLIVAGSALGIVLVLLERAFPKYKKYIPSATGLGLAFTLSFANAFSMFAGAVVALVLEKRRPALAERYVVPVSSGIIAGEGIMAVIIKVLERVHLLSG
jgi:OPT family oligopeptide transporter